MKKPKRIETGVKINTFEFSIPISQNWFRSKLGTVENATG